MRRKIFTLVIIVMSLIVLSLYSTYALFNTIISDENPINLNSDITYNFDIYSTKTFTIAANTVTYFNANVNNTTNGIIKYALYHNFDLINNSNVIIGEIVEDETIITAPNTTGTLSGNTSKKVSIAIKNSSSNTITVTIGLITGYANNNLTYGTGNYLINNTVTTNIVGNTTCINDTNVLNCINKEKDGTLYKYCEYENLGTSLNLDIGLGNIVVENISTSNRIKVTGGGLTSSVEISNTFPITVSGNTTTNMIKITANTSILNINNISIDLSSVTCTSNFQGYNGVIDNRGINTTINIIGTNYIKGTDCFFAGQAGASGIFNDVNSTITLQGTGQLTAIGTGYGAGIGGIGENVVTTLTGGNIVINSGTIIATGGNGHNNHINFGNGSGGSGIGSGGYNLTGIVAAPINNDITRVGKSITINGGSVTATGGYCAAGIGGGGVVYDANSYMLTDEQSYINGGTITVSNGATVNNTAGTCNSDIYYYAPQNRGNGGFILYSQY